MQPIKCSLPNNNYNNKRPLEYLLIISFLPKKRLIECIECKEKLRFAAERFKIAGLASKKSFSRVSNPRRFLKPSTPCGSKKT